MRTYIKSPEHRTNTWADAEHHSFAVVPERVPKRQGRLTWDSMLDMTRRRYVLVHCFACPRES